MLKVVFNTAPLVTCCKFYVQDKPIIDHILESCRVIVPSMVSLESTLEKERYVDAIIAEERIKAGRIEVRDVELPFENVLNYYGLGAGEKEAIVLAHEIEAEIDFLVIDDKLGYIVCDRLGISKAFFLDLILRLVEKRMMADKLARRIIEAVKPRYSEGLIQHSLWILERGDRKCLW